MYQVSNMGRVKSLKKKQPVILQGSYDKDGYLQVGLSNNSKSKTIRVHRLVATTFLDNPENKPEINHKNEIRDDNRLTNLEWTTRKENIAHGTHNKKLSEARIKNNYLYKRAVDQYDIDGKLLNTYDSIKEAAECTGISKITISGCCVHKYKKCRQYIWRYKGDPI